MLETNEISIPMSKGKIIFTSVLFIMTWSSLSAVATLQPQTTKLGDYQTIIALEDGTLADPRVLAFDGRESIFIFDRTLSKVIEVNEEGEVIQEYGRQGHGPGEIQNVSRIIPDDEYVYLVDTNQYFIHRFNRKGEHGATLNYGEVGANRINEPHITNDGKVLISPTYIDEFIYHYADWDGEIINQIGNIAEGSDPALDREELYSSISERQMPPHYKNSVVVLDAETPEPEWYLIYNVKPKITRYNAFGERVFEKPITAVPEFDSIKTGYLNIMEQAVQPDGPLPPLASPAFYPSGQVVDEYLYLATNTNFEYSTLWIHKFNADGDLKKRLRLESETDLWHDIAINGNDRKIYVLTDEAELRAYAY